MTFDKLFSRLILLEAEERHTPRGNAGDAKSVLLGRSFSPRGFASQSSLPTGEELPDPERFERGSLLERKPELKLADAVKGNMNDEQKAMYNSIARSMKFAAATPAAAKELSDAFKSYIDMHSQMMAYKQMADNHSIRTGDEKSGKELQAQVPKRIEQLLDLEAGANDMANQFETERKFDKQQKAIDLRNSYREYIKQYEREVSGMLDEAKKIAGKLSVVSDATLAKVSRLISDAQPASEVDNKQYIRAKINGFADFIRDQRNAIKDGIVPVSGKTQKWWFTLDPIRVLFGIWNGVRNKGMTVQSSIGKKTKSSITDLLQSTKQLLDQLNSPKVARGTSDVAQLAKEVENAKSLHDDAQALNYILQVVSSSFTQRVNTIKHPLFIKGITNLKNVDDDKKAQLKGVIEILQDDSTSEYQGNERGGIPSAETRAKQLIANIVSELSQREELQSPQQQATES